MKRNFFKYLLLSMLYYLGAFMMILLLLRFFNAESIWSKNPLLNWDAAHYDYIAHKEYTGFRNTFFPLFPFIWRYLRIGQVEITLFNGLVYIISASALGYSMNFPLKKFTLMLTFPSLIFLFLPYSESLFFCACAFALIGIHKKNYSIMFVSLFVATLARSVGCIFIPVAVAFFILDKESANSIKKIALYVVPVILGIAAVVIIQYYCTGDWFAFSHAEKQWWGNDFKFPKLHLTSWGGDNIVRLDGTALLTGIIATMALFRIFFKRIKGMEVKASQVLIFSMLYLAGISWFVLFTRGGSLFSLNRFVYATPFFFVAFYAFVKQTWTPKQYLLIFIGLNAFWLLLGSYVHIQQVLKFLLLSLFIMSFMFVSHSKKYLAVPAYLICIIGNVALQVYCYYYFLNGGWIG